MLKLLHPSKPVIHRTHLWRTFLRQCSHDARSLPPRHLPTANMAAHPVGSSQQSVQLPALDAPHAPTAQAGAQPKAKKEKVKAAGSEHPLEVRQRP